MIEFLFSLFTFSVNAMAGVIPVIVFTHTIYLTYVYIFSKKNIIQEIKTGLVRTIENESLLCEIPEVPFKLVSYSSSQADIEISNKKAFIFSVIVLPLLKVLPLIAFICFLSCVSMSYFGYGFCNAGATCTTEININFDKHTEVVDLEVISGFIFSTGLLAYILMLILKHRFELNVILVAVCPKFKEKKWRDYFL